MFYLFIFVFLVSFNKCLYSWRLKITKIWLNKLLVASYNLYNVHLYINKLFYSFYLFLFFSTCRWRYTWFGFFTDFEMCQQNVYDNHFFRISVCLSVLLKYNTFQFIQMKSSWNSKQQTLIKWMFKIVDKNLWEDWGAKIVNQTVKFMVWQNFTDILQ